EFLAGLDIAYCMDENAIVFFDGFAVWVAGMVNPARVVAVNLRIDYFTVVQAEVECVRIVLVVGSGFPRHALPCVFDDASAFGNELCGVSAATVYAGL